MHMKIILLVAMVAFTGSIRAQEALTFKGFNLGADRASFLAAFPKPSMACSESTCFWSGATACRGHDYQECRKALSYGGVMPLSVMARFSEDKLVSVYLKFSSDRFPDLSAAMVERFGQPDKDEPSVIQNRMGATFDNRELRWMRGDAGLSIKQRAGKIDEGSVSFMSMEHARQQFEERAKSVKQKAKDL
jgi:hypothetical protein